MKVPLSIFSTFVAATPTAKLACVEQLKSGYDVRTDWYRKLRDAITSNHRDGGTQDDLGEFVDTVNGKKAESYRSRVVSYCDWWADRNINWVGAKPFLWSAGEVEVMVNPELVISVDGVRHAIRLHFAAEKLSEDRANVILRLLEIGFRDGASPSGRPVVGVLDIAQERLITPSKSLAYLDPLLVGEAASLVAISKA